MRSHEERPENYNAESTDCGVVVHGYSTDGWITNTNSYPTKIKKVWRARGETTSWIGTLAPGEKQQMFVDWQHGFYVYDADGNESCYIKPIRNGE